MSVRPGAWLHGIGRVSEFLGSGQMLDRACPCLHGIERVSGVQEPWPLSGVPGREVCRSTASCLERQHAVHLHTYKVS